MSTIDMPAFPARASSRRDQAKTSTFSLRGRMIVGSVVAVLLVGGLGGWSATANLAGAVISSGTVLVAGNVKVIQHLEGGTVRSIEVRKGEKVQAGEVLLRLDDIQIRTERSILLGQLAELVARRARLIAERDTAADIEFPADYLDRFPDGSLILSGERQLFVSTSQNRRSQRAQLEAQIAQLQEEVGGLHLQAAALADELVLAQQERARMGSLLQKELIQATRINAADRELAKMSGSNGELTASIARANARMSEVRLQILAVDEIASTDAQRELRVVEANMSEASNRLAGVEDRLRQTQIRAPVSGTINELTVTTLGGVIGPGEKLMTLVPEGADLKVEFRVAINDIDQIHIGQAVRLRFSAFDQRTTPEVDAIVARVSAAATTDPQTGVSYFTGEAEMPNDVSALGGHELVPGMPVEVFVQTREQVAIAYFAKPFTDQIVRAFREE